MNKAVSVWARGLLVTLFSLASYGAFGATASQTSSTGTSAGDATSSLSTTVTSTTRKANYGHYFATRYADTPDDVAMLCDQPGVSGVVWRRTWKEVEPVAGVYDFSSFDKVLRAIAGSHNPQCQLWIFVEWKSFAGSPIKNPCPTYLQARIRAQSRTGPVRRSVSCGNRRAARPTSR